MLREAGRDVRVGGNIGQAVTGLPARGRHGADRVRAGGVELPAGGHRHLPPAGGGLPEPLRRPPRPPPQLRGLRPGQGAHLREPDGGGLGGRERGRPARDGAGRGWDARAAAVPPSGSPSAVPTATGLLRGRRGRAALAARRGDALPPRARCGCRARTWRRPAGGRHRGAPDGRGGRGDRARGAPLPRRPHVLERWPSVDGVAFFNDSKATNVDAARRSLDAFSGRCWPSSAGATRAATSRTWRPALEAHGKAVFAIGEAAPPRARGALGAVVPVFDCASLEEAVERAREEAERGDTVLLAPACSSFDMFQDYADRGDAFRRIVRELVERASRAKGPPEWLRSCRRTSCSSP